MNIRRPKCFSVLCNHNTAGQIKIKVVLTNFDGVNSVGLEKLNKNLLTKSFDYFRNRL